MSLFYSNDVFHPQGHWPKNKQIDKLDPPGNASLNGIITSHETTTNALQQTFERMAYKSGPKVQAFTIGWQVVLETGNLDAYEMYSDTFTGPFPLSEQKGSLAYKVQLPDGWKIHKLCHKILLRPYTEDQYPSRQLLIRK